MRFSKKEEMTYTDFTKFPLLEYIIKNEKDLSSLRKLLQSVPVMTGQVLVWGHGYGLIDMPARAQLVEPQLTTDFADLLDSAGDDGTALVDRITGPYARVVFSGDIITKNFRKRHRISALLTPDSTRMEDTTQTMWSYHHPTLNDAHILWHTGRHDSTHIKYVHFILK